MRDWTRRDALGMVGAAVSGLALSGAGWGAKTDGAPERVLRAAILGHTGAGDFGHGYDQVFNGLEQVRVEAVADPDAEGRRKAAVRCGAQRLFADYRELLTEVKPDLVSVAMRHPRAHPAIVRAALEVGAHLFIEKPFTETLAEADALVAAAEARGRRMVVAHNRRYTAEFVRVKALLAEGFLGEVREVRMQGKQDARAGGEDMMVLGTHDFDLLRFYFGDPRWCFASVTVGGRDVTPADARDGREPIRVAGDTIHAQFAFGGGVEAKWVSVRRGDGWNMAAPRRENWAFEILGTKRALAYQSGVGFWYLDSPYLLQPPGERAWQPLPAPARSDASAHLLHMGRDLVHAVESGSEPRCSGRDGRWAIEMVTAVYQSHFARARVSFPLEDRRDPLRAG